MRFLDEYRDREAVLKLADAIAATVTRPWVLMEVCGGQTHSILRFGLDRLLPESLELVHGPGCPVCVTPLAVIDRALAIAARPGVTFCTFGDMLRVPGSGGDLYQAKAAGADVRVVYSPLDAVELAKVEPDREVVFFAIGFETTAPVNAMAIWRAKHEGVTNFSVVASHVLVPPAIEALVTTPGNRVQAFLAAGHVCTVMGIDEYPPLAERFGVPIVVTGFEPVDLLAGVHAAVVQLEAGRAEVENRYARSVKPGGNPRAQEMLREVFEVVPQTWRGIGEIAKSGLGLAPAYRDHDAVVRFADLFEGFEPAPEDPACISGEILRGVKKPGDCPEFGRRCTPQKPLGAPMVSNEGACSAYFRYRGQELVSEGAVD